jgi:hypothetical protein
MEATAMPELNFVVEDMEVERHGVSPHLAVQLRIMNVDGMSEIRSISLHAQVRIEADERHYDPIGKSALWAHTGVNVPGFDHQCSITLPLPCSFDFNVAATRYFYSLDGGSVPLEFLFNGTVFFARDGGPLKVEQIPWTKSARYRFPVRVWQEMMDMYYPDSVWLRLPRRVFDRLYRYKRERGLPKWEQALNVLLDGPVR